MTLPAEVVRCAEAFRSPCFPCNPLPFLGALREGVKEMGTDWIKSNTAKQILWVLMAQSYGQMATIDLFDEWGRLDKVVDPEQKDIVT